MLTTFIFLLLTLMLVAVPVVISLAFFMFNCSPIFSTMLFDFWYVCMISTNVHEGKNGIEIDSCKSPGIINLDSDPPKHTLCNQNEDLLQLNFLVLPLNHECHQVAAFSESDKEQK